MERDDLFRGEQSRRAHFNSRAHVERDFCTLRALYYCTRFQLTRSRGARPPRLSTPAQHAAFQLTRSRGARRGAGWICLTGFTFQLTRSRGARLSNPSEVAPWGVFQLTRSRGARLVLHKSSIMIIRISTHALTWSATNMPMTHMG